MDKPRVRNIYVSRIQKRKLLKLIAINKDNANGKTKGSKYEDTMKLWHNIATQCNALPGAKKTWQQWRKSYHDIKCKMKKRSETTHIDDSDEKIDAECSQETEFVPIAERNPEVNAQMFNSETDPSDTQYSNPESPLEAKVFSEERNIQTDRQQSNLPTSGNFIQTTDCALNCQVFADQEEQKLKLKKDFYDFKKRYLTEKLKLLKQQTEALQTIAKGFSSKE